MESKNNTHESVFAAPPVEEYTPEIETPNTAIVNEEKITEPINEDSNFVYSLMSGMDETEYYTFNCPEIINGSVVIRDPFKKSFVTQHVLEENIHEYYRATIAVKELSFDISEGIFTKCHLKSEIYWLTQDEATASNKIKDAVILKYNQMVPNLINRMNILDEQLKYKKEQNDDLMEL